MRRRSTKTAGRFCVLDRSFPSVGAAVSWAQNKVVRGEHEILEVSVPGQGRVALVERRGKIVYTT